MKTSIFVKYCQKQENNLDSVNNRSKDTCGSEENGGRLMNGSFGERRSLEGVGEKVTSSLRNKSGHFLMKNTPVYMQYFIQYY